MRASFISKLSKKFDQVNTERYKLKLAKAQIEQKERILVGFLILPYASVPKKKIYNNFSAKVCDVQKFEELKKDTDSVYLALAGTELEDCKRKEEMNAE